MTNELSDRNPSRFHVGGGRQDRLFGVLSHPHRRFVLDKLLTVEMPVSVSELSTELGAWEASASDGSGDRADAVEISLVHDHLPKMAEADLIRWDVAERTVTLADRTDEVRARLRTTNNQR